MKKTSRRPKPDFPSILIPVALTFAISAFASWGWSYTSEVPHDEQPGTVPSDAASPATPDASPGVNEVNVTIESGAASRTTDAFGVNPLVVAIGSTVTWTNNDTIPHTVTSKPDETLFDSETIPPGGKFSHKFETAGTFDYYCEIHPAMVGSVQVQ